jgi:hypothetical protein
MTREKLIQFGWVDEHGSSLSWRHWQHRKHRIAVSYWRNTVGKLQPTFYIAENAMNRK